VPSVVVPSGKLRTDAPPASTASDRRSAVAPLHTDERSTNDTPTLRAVPPISGQLATSPLAMAAHGVSDPMTTGSR
jgi:hypothetical protein